MHPNEWKDMKQSKFISRWDNTFYYGNFLLFLIPYNKHVLFSNQKNQ